MEKSEIALWVLLVLFALLAIVNSIFLWMPAAKGLEYRSFDLKIKSLESEPTVKVLYLEKGSIITLVFPTIAGVTLADGPIITSDSLPEFVVPAKKVSTATSFEVSRISRISRGIDSPDGSLARVSIFKDASSGKNLLLIDEIMDGPIRTGSLVTSSGFSITYDRSA